MLRAATINAAYELHEDDATGSIEVGKFADIIVLDRNPLKIPPEDIHNIEVLETMVGGNGVSPRSKSGAVWGRAAAGRTAEPTCHLRFPPPTLRPNSAHRLHLRGFQLRRSLCYRVTSNSFCAAT